MAERGVKTRNNLRWTEARFKSFVTGALRNAKWPIKYLAISNAFVKDGANPKTGNRCKLHKCSDCKELFAKGDMKADHINPVVDPKVGFVDFNTFIERLFIEIDGYQVLCKECHDAKSKEENKTRKEFKK